MKGATFVATFCVFLTSWASAESSSLEPVHRSGRLDLGDIANEIVGRADSNSQVLSLNLTNLVILLVLKGLLFGATYWGGGGGGGFYGGGGGGSYGHGYGYGGGHRSSPAGRQLDDSVEPFMSETEAMLVASYLMGDASRNFDCLFRVACQDPGKSKKYLDASKVLLKTSKIFPDIIGFDKKYETLIGDLQEAINFGTKYGTCEQKYTCKQEKHNASRPA